MGSAAPEFAGIVNWINSPPLTMEELRGKVVLIDFWTYTCINCIRTLPYIKEWHAKYADRGLVIVGVHSPEFEFEKRTDNVVRSAEESGLAYPIAQDNEFGTWRAFNNNAWPSKFLIDAAGTIRYAHVGEGAYRGDGGADTGAADGGGGGPVGRGGERGVGAAVRPARLRR